MLSRHFLTPCLSLALVAALSPAAFSQDLDKLIGDLGSSSGGTQKAAAEALGKLGGGAGDALDGLFDLVRNGSGQARLEGAKAIGKIGKENRGALVDVLTGNPDIMSKVSELTDKGGPIVEKAMSTLMDGNVDALMGQFGSLSDIGDKTKILDAVGAGGLAAAAAAPDLISAFGDGDADVRRAAVDAMGDVGRNNDNNVAALEEAAKDSDKEVADAATKALNKVTGRKAGGKKSKKPGRG